MLFRLKPRRWSVQARRDWIVRCWKVGIFWNYGRISTSRRHASGGNWACSVQLWQPLLAVAKTQTRNKVQQTQVCCYNVIHITYQIRRSSRRPWVFYCQKYVRIADSLERAWHGTEQNRRQSTYGKMTTRASTWTSHSAESTAMLSNPRYLERGTDTPPKVMCLHRRTSHRSSKPDLYSFNGALNCVG